jgi:hypothetical protein
MNPIRSIIVFFIRYDSRAGNTDWEVLVEKFLDGPKRFISIFFHSILFSLPISYLSRWGSATSITTGIDKRKLLGV